MDTPTLQEANHDNIDALYHMHTEMDADEHGFTNPAFGMSRKAFDGYIDTLIYQSKGLDLRPGLVPQTTFWLMRGDYPLGLSRLRHYLNDNLRKAGGNIGFYIRPSERGKGYGNLILSLALIQAARMSLDRVLLTCDSDNAGSKRVIENNGGVLEREDIRMQFCYYWIDLVTP